MDTGVAKSILDFSNGLSQFTFRLKLNVTELNKQLINRNYITMDFSELNYRLRELIKIAVNSDRLDSSATSRIAVKYKNEMEYVISNLDRVINMIEKDNLFPLVNYRYERNFKMLCNIRNNFSELIVKDENLVEIEQNNIIKDLANSQDTSYVDIIKSFTDEMESIYGKGSVISVVQVHDEFIISLDKNVLSGDDGKLEDSNFFK